MSENVPIKEIQKMANASYNKLKNMFEEFKSINDESEQYIYNYFSELERQVDIKRDVLIDKIHKISDKLRGEINVQKEEIQSYSAKRIKKQNIDQEFFKKYEKQLYSYNQIHEIQKSEEFLLEFDRLKSIQIEIENKRNELRIKIEELKSELFCNRSIIFNEGHAKFDPTELFGQIFVEDSKVINLLIFILFHQMNIFIFSLNRTN